MCLLSYAFASCNKITGNKIIIAINACSHSLLGSCWHSAILAICSFELRYPVIDSDVPTFTNMCKFHFWTRTWTQCTCSPNNIHNQVIVWSYFNKCLFFMIEICIELYFLIFFPYEGNSFSIMYIFCCRQDFSM